MRAHNALTALVSGGFTWFSGRVAALCGFDVHHANLLGLADGRLTGAVAEPVLGAGRPSSTRCAAWPPRARAALWAPRWRSATAPTTSTCCARAGLGIAYRARPVVADAVANRIEHADLRAALFAQGYPASAFVE